MFRREEDDFDGNVMASDSPVAYALDFDGVVCDSVGESSHTALRAAARLWPQLNITEPYDESYLSALRKVRPVVETGYENVLLGRLVYECPIESVNEDFIEPVLNDWTDIRDSALEDWNVSKEELIDIFGSTRDEWIESNVDSWVDANRM